MTSAIEADPAFAHVHPPTPAVVVEVADDGPGVAAETTDKIFNPFFTTKVTGTGLGLAIVRKIVDAHDGRIDVSSEQGLGHEISRHAAGDERVSVVQVGLARRSAQREGG